MRDAARASAATPRVTGRFRGHWRTASAPLMGGCAVPDGMAANALAHSAKPATRAALQAVSFSDITRVHCLICLRAITTAWIASTPAAVGRVLPRQGRQVAALFVSGTRVVAQSY